MEPIAEMIRCNRCGKLTEGEFEVEITEGVALVQIFDSLCASCIEDIIEFIETPI